MATSAQNRLSEEIKPLINDLIADEAHGTSGNDVLYRRVLTPGADYVNHANKIGVRLKSAAILQKSVLTRPPTRAGLSARVKSSPHRKITNLPSAQYIQDIVVPIQKNAGRESTHRDTSGLPHMKHSAKSTGRAVTATSLSLYTSDQYSTAQPVCHHGNGRSRWNRSEQASRFEMEQEQKAQSQKLKRTSEVRPHRVDRMYYMSGSAMAAADRYHVDEVELQQLKELARARKEAKHYGRGLSKLKYDAFQNGTPPTLTLDSEDQQTENLIIQPPNSCKEDMNANSTNCGFCTTLCRNPDNHEQFLSIYTIELQPPEGSTSPAYVYYRNNLESEEMSVSPQMFINRQKDLSLPSARFGGWFSPRDCDCKHGLEQYVDTYIQGMAVSCP